MDLFAKTLNNHRLIYLYRENGHTNSYTNVNNLLSKGVHPDDIETGATIIDLDTKKIIPGLKNWYPDKTEATTDYYTKIGRQHLVSYAHMSYYEWEGILNLAETERQNLKKDFPDVKIKCKSQPGTYRTLDIKLYDKQKTLYSVFTVGETSENACPWEIQRQIETVFQNIRYELTDHRDLLPEIIEEKS